MLLNQIQTEVETNEIKYIQVILQDFLVGKRDTSH